MQVEEIVMEEIEEVSDFVQPVFEMTKKEEVK
jgi:hypothetical protein